MVIKFVSVHDCKCTYRNDIHRNCKMAIYIIIYKSLALVCLYIFQNGCTTCSFRDYPANSRQLTIDLNRLNSHLIEVSKQGVCRYSPKPSHNSEGGGEAESSQTASTKAWEEAIPGDTSVLCSQAYKTCNQETLQISVQ
jgi:hypothetical protein